MIILWVLLVPLGAAVVLAVGMDLRQRRRGRRGFSVDSRAQIVRKGLDGVHGQPPSQSQTSPHG